MSKVIVTLSVFPFSAARPQANEENVACLVTLGP